MLHRKIFFKAIQFLIAAVVLIYLCSKLDVAQIGELIHGAVLSYLLLAFLILVGQIVIAAYRWLLVMRLSGFSLPLWPCVGAFAVSSLINTTLPVAISGDIMRMWVTTKNGMPAGSSICTVLLDRVLNTLGLGFMVIAILLPHMLWAHTSPFDIRINLITLGFATMLFISFIGLVLLAPLLKRYNICLPFVLAPLDRLSRMSWLLFQHPLQTLFLFGVIFIGHFMLITAIGLLAYGLHIQLSFMQALIGIPIALLFSAIPITPGGWGIRESTMVVALGQFHVIPEAALGISILYGIGSTLGSLPAAIVWFMQKNRSDKIGIPITTSILP